jgi:hypothetical protein
MGKTHFVQKHSEGSGFAIFERGQNAFIKEAH